MGSNKDSLALFDLWDDFLVPERQSPGNRVLQALARRQLVLRQVSVATVLGGTATLTQQPNAVRESGGRAFIPPTPKFSAQGPATRSGKPGLEAKKRL